MFNREKTPTTNTTMKSIQNLLPALALVFGATLAMAMNFANPIPSQVFTRNPDTGLLDDVSHLQIGQDYDCLDDGECLLDENEQVIQNGTFTMRP